MKRTALALAVVLCASAVWAGLEGAGVPYRDGDAKLAGELFKHDTDTEGRGGVVIFHQWTGISDHERGVARKLAAEGFDVLCADVYGEGIRPQAPEACMAETAKYKADRDLTRSRTRTALDTLRARARLGRKPVVAIGYCFGGLCALELARSGADLQGAVSFHGALDTSKPAQPDAVKARVLVLHGADDPYVPAADVQALEKEMKDAGADYRFVAYPGAVHSFTVASAGADPSTGVAYNAAADKGSWAEFHKLLAEIAPRSAPP